MSAAAATGLRDRFRGALLGTLAGDALGMPVEGWPARRIRRELGEVREMLDARLGAGTYTDDTQMTAALAGALLEAESPCRPELDVIARRFGERFDPNRGYGGNSRKILAAIRDGEPWRRAVDARRFPGGSYGDGAAMRAAPAALGCFPDGAGAVRLADAQAKVTGHDHPEGRFGARLQAAGVLAGLRDGRDVDAPSPARSWRRPRRVGTRTAEFRIRFGDAWNGSPDISTPRPTRQQPRSGREAVRRGRCRPRTGRSSPTPTTRRRPW